MARGIDVGEIDLIIQMEPPKDIESYVHRAGRAGRKGKKGVCILMYNGEEVRGVQKIARFAKVKFE